MMIFALVMLKGHACPLRCSQRIRKHKVRWTPPEPSNALPRIASSPPRRFDLIRGWTTARARAARERSVAYSCLRLQIALSPYQTQKTVEKSFLQLPTSNTSKYCYDTPRTKKRDTHISVENIALFSVFANLPKSLNPFSIPGRVANSIPHNSAAKKGQARMPAATTCLQAGWLRPRSSRRRI